MPSIPAAARIIAAVLLGCATTSADWSLDRFIASACRDRNIPHPNRIVLHSIRGMPTAGGYSTNRDAHRKIADAVTSDDHSLVLRPDLARPSFCSGATYLVFLRSLLALQQQGQLKLAPKHLQAFTIDGPDHPDGLRVWGRWNANGPGTAVLFRTLRLGRNFDDLDAALPGDFLKIFWNEHVGKRELGHSAIFLENFKGANGTPMIRYWSSNQPDGFGAKTAARSRMKRALLSRLETPRRATAAGKLKPMDPYLSQLLTRESSFAEAWKKAGVADHELPRP